MWISGWSLNSGPMLLPRTAVWRFVGICWQSISVVWTWRQRVTTCPVTLCGWSCRTTRHRAFTAWGSVPVWLQKEVFYFLSPKIETKGRCYHVTKGVSCLLYRSWTTLQLAHDVILLASLSQDLRHTLQWLDSECEPAGMRVCTSTPEAVTLSGKRIDRFLQSRSLHCATESK